MTLSRTTARLTAMGQEGLLHALLDNTLTETAELQFASLKVAKMLQSLLYKWLTFHPEVKARVSLRLVDQTATLLVMPRGIKEKRGRRRNI